MGVNDITQEECSMSSEEGQKKNPGVNQQLKNRQRKKRHTEIWWETRKNGKKGHRRKREEESRVTNVK